MNHATYLQVFEEARWEIIDNHGFDVKTIQTKRIGPTILKVEIDYKRELLNRQWIKIVTRPTPMKKKIGFIYQQMTNEKDEVCSDIKITYGLFDLNKRKLIEPPLEWLDALNLPH